MFVTYTHYTTIGDMKFMAHSYIRSRARNLTEQDRIIFTDTQWWGEMNQLWELAVSLQAFNDGTFSNLNPITYRSGKFVTNPKKR